MRNTTRPFRAGVLAAALLAAFSHLIPYWHAEAEASSEPEWSFTGSLIASPDMFQYRAWLRHTQVGPLVENRFTTEPNRPYLFLPLHYTVGQSARLLGLRPETAYHYGGAIIAFALVILIASFLRRFLGVGGRTVLVLFVVVFGGGLIDHVLLFTRSLHIGPWLTLGTRLRFDGQRMTHLITTLRDTQHLFVWLLVISALLTYYLAAKHPTARRIGLAAAMCAALTISHPYESALIVSVMAAFCLLLWLRRLPVRPALVATVWCLLAILVAGLVWSTTYLRSGLQLTDWYEDPIPLLLVLLTYPIPFALIAWRGARYWRHADFDRVFLLAWVLGAMTLVFSAPLFPYPVRAMIAVSVPLYAMAAIIFFGDRKRLRPLAVVVLVLATGLTPFQRLRSSWKHTEFSEDRPAMFIHTDHRRIVNRLNALAEPDDALLAEASDLHWLAPDYPGRLFVGHWFHTVDYPAKRRTLRRFFDGPADGMQDILASWGIRFFFASGASAVRADSVAAFRALERTKFGTLYAYVPADGPD